ncbi:MAG: small heat shock protein [Caulobacteraceae bacterium]|jgi:HSP20 family protein|nr:small heat shock protein [Caulobacteraceae bacterium]
MATQHLVPWGRNGGRNRNLPAELDPEATFFTLHRQMNRLFDDFFRGFDTPALMGGGNGGMAAVTNWPRLEVEETENEYRIHAELPGMDEKDVEVLLEDGVLVLRGEKQQKIEDRSRAVSERFYGRFERRIALDGVDVDHIQAKFENGVLTITAPKSAQGRERVRRIFGQPRQAGQQAQVGQSDQGGQASDTRQSGEASQAAQASQANQANQPGQSEQPSQLAH